MVDWIDPIVVFLVLLPLWYGVYKVIRFGIKK